MGFSHCGTWAQWLQLLGSRVQASSCGPWTSLLHGTWDLSRPGIEPMSPALAGEFFTTESPGKPLHGIF